MEPNFPMEKDLEADEQAPGSWQPDPREFRMFPYKDGMTGENKVFFSLFHPSRFKHLKEWPEDTTTWYLKFFLHWPTATNEEGKDYKVPVICEPSFNKYARERLTQPNLIFAEPFPGVEDCEFCNKSQGYWDMFREEKVAKGIENLSIDEYKKAMSDYPEIAKLKDQAREWGVGERIYFVIFDYKKFMSGKVGEDMGFQYYWAPTKILGELWKEYKGGYKFYDPTGNPIVNVTRENPPTSKGGNRWAKYSLRVANESPEWGDVTLAYLQRLDDIPDPFDSVQIWTPGQKLAYVKQHPNGTQKTDIQEPDDDDLPVHTDPASAKEEEVQVRTTTSSRPRIAPRAAQPQQTPELEPATPEQTAQVESKPRRPKLSVTFRGDKPFQP